MTPKTTRQKISLANGSRDLQIVILHGNAGSKTKLASGMAARTQVLIQQLIVAIGDSLGGRVDLAAAGALDFALGAAGVHLVQLGADRLARLASRQRARARVTTGASISGAGCKR
jgi:hypothetical protein